MSDVCSAVVSHTCLLLIKGHTKTSSHLLLKRINKSQEEARLYLVGVQVWLVAEGAANLPDILGLDLEGEVRAGTLAAAAVSTLQHRHHLHRGKVQMGFLLCLLPGNINNRKRKRFTDNFSTVTFTVFTSENEQII